MADGSVYSEKATYKMINEIMDCFDFSRVHKTMVALEWSWASIEGTGIPCEPEIRSAARELLTECAFSTSGFRGTGGLEAQRCEAGLLRLKFCVSDWAVEGCPE